MRALFLVSASEWGGAARVFVQSALGLAERGIDVTLICRAGSGVADHVRERAVDVVELPPGSGRLRTVWALRRALRERPVNVVFVHTIAEQRLADRARRLAARRTPVRRKQSFEELGVDVVVLDALAPPSRATLHASSEGPLVGCWCGRDARIAIVRALRALSRVAIRHHDLHALMLGPGAGDDTLRMHAAALGLHGALTWIPEEMAARRAMRAADIGWVAAQGDDAGFAVLECMAARIPVVAHDDLLARRFLGGGEAGLLVNTADAQRAASELALLIAHPARCAQLGEAGRARVEHWFTERAMVDGFAEVAANGGGITQGPAVE